MTSLLNSLENLLIPAPQAYFVPTFPKKKKKLQSLDLDEENRRTTLSPGHPYVPGN